MISISNHYHQEKAKSFLQKSGQKLNKVFTKILQSFYLNIQILGELSVKTL